MLIQLTINQFAIVDQLDIEFKQGMSVITGETGAGKSIALDALGICLGQRADTTMLRNADKRAEVCAVFQLSHHHLAYQWLGNQDLQDSENPEICIIRRVINPDGRSKAFINSTPVTLQQLKNLGSLLMQINGQHNSQLLLRSDYQLKTLDNYCCDLPIFHQMSSQYHHWKDIQQQLKQLQNLRAENNARKQLLEYQVAELDEFNLKENEFKELEIEHKRLANSENLSELAQSSLQLLSENEEVNIESLLYRTSQYLSELSQMDNGFDSVNDMVQEALIQVQEASSEIQQLTQKIEPDPQALYEVETRLSQAIQLARKHNVKGEELFSTHQNLALQLAELENISSDEESLILAEQTAYAEMLATAKELHKLRVKKAQELSNTLTQEIQKLAMEQAVFAIQINFDENKISSQGGDNVEFLLQSNLGQSLQPLNKTASGGELSRIALILQVLTAHQNAIPSLVFDEIDTGISGATAKVVGQLLRQLGEKVQVICVTHLPQVASCAHNHFAVEKNIAENQTITTMIPLSSKERINALAKLLGGTEITPKSIANAKEMLEKVS